MVMKQFVMKDPLHLTPIVLDKLNTFQIGDNYEIYNKIIPLKIPITDSPILVVENVELLDFENYVYQIIFPVETLFVEMILHRDIRALHNGAR